MQDTTRSVNLSRILPAIDLGLLLVVMICGTASMSWVTAAPRPAPGANSLATPAPEATAQTLDALKEEIQRLERELDPKTSEAKQLQAALKKAERDRPDPEAAKKKQSRTRQDVESLRQRLETLKEKLSQLQREALGLQNEKQRLERLRKALADIAAQIRQWEEELKQLRETNTRLKKDIAEIRTLPIDRPTVRINCNPLYRSEKDRKSVFVILAEGKVTPLAGPYYTTTTTSYQKIYSRVRHAETAEQASASGSAFQRLLGKIDPTREFVFLVVDSSSFETFRKVRDLLQRQGIPFGWDPNNRTATIVLGVGGRDQGTVK